MRHYRTLSLVTAALVTALALGTDVMAQRTSATAASTLEALGGELNAIAGSGSLTYSSYVTIATRGQASDDEVITVQVPSEWNQVETDAWTYQGQQAGMFVAASAHLNRFYLMQSESGVFIGTSHLLAQLYRSVDAVLNLEQLTFKKRCKYKGRFDYHDNFYKGHYDDYSNCSTGSPDVFVIVTLSGNQKSLVLIRINAPRSADFDAKARILDTFQILPASD